MNQRLSPWWPASPVGQVLLSIILVLTFIAPSFHTLPSGTMLFAPDLLAGVLGTLTLYLLVVGARWSIGNWPRFCRLVNSLTLGSLAALAKLLCALVIASIILLLLGLLG